MGICESLGWRSRSLVQSISPVICPNADAELVFGSSISSNLELDTLGRVSTLNLTNIYTLVGENEPGERTSQIVTSEGGILKDPDSTLVAYIHHHSQNDGDRGL